MKWHAKRYSLFPALLSLFCFLSFAGAETFRVATYNVESYLEAKTATRAAKPAAAKAKVRESILALRPDVLALQEIGGVPALLELRDSLRTNGLDLPYWEHVAGPDTNIHVAILSRFPIVARRSQTNEDFLLGGRRFHVSRGFGEVDIRVNDGYQLTLLTTHLKSKRPTARADEADLRLEEAKLLRERIDALLNARPDLNLVVLGDLNDSKDAASTKAVIGRGKHKLIDTRPAEKNGRERAAPEARTVCWTHYYAQDDTYSRIDYVLISSALARHWVTNETYVLAMPNWGLASDHRPLVATFATGPD